MRSRSIRWPAALLASLVLGSAARADDPPPYEAPDALQTPPGSKEDQALWWRAMDASNEVSTSRATSAKLQWRARSGTYEKRLAEKATGLPAPEAERLAGLGKKVQAAAKANYDLVSSRWPIDPTRGCQYPAQQLESAMHVSAGPEKSVLLDAARTDTKRCVDLAESVLRKMARSNEEFAKALADADAALQAPAR